MNPGDKDIGGWAADLDRYPYIPSRCVCDDPTVEGFTKEVFAAVAEGLSMLDNLLCFIMLKALMTIVEEGIGFVPVAGPVFRGFTTAVRAAKSFAENAGAATDMFQGWIGPACGMPGPALDPAAMFKQLVETPDEFGTSIGCKRTSSLCKKLPDPDPKNRPTKKADNDQPNNTGLPIPGSTKKLDNDQPNTGPPIPGSTQGNNQPDNSGPPIPGSTKKADNDQPSNTGPPIPGSTQGNNQPSNTGPPAPGSTQGNDQPSSTDDPTTACKLKRSLPELYRVKGDPKPGDRKRGVQSVECFKGKTTTWQYEITSIQWAPAPTALPVTATCSDKAGQACHHYQSAIDRNPEWKTLTCPGIGADKRNDRDKKSPAVRKFYSGVADVWRDEQWREHKDTINARTGRRTPGCQADEFPPYYLLSEMDTAWKNGGKSMKGQLIRYITHEENSSGGDLWKGVCFYPVFDKYNAQQLWDQAKQKQRGLGKKTAGTAINGDESKWTQARLTNTGTEQILTLGQPQSRKKRLRSRSTSDPPSRSNSSRVIKTRLVRPRRFSG